MNNKKPAKTGNDSTEKNDSIISQFIELRREVDYYTCDCAIDFLAARFRNGEFFISAEYQRNFVWDKTRKCRFIESILLGYPIPIMFFSDNDDGRCDIVDGAQRTSALEEFLGSDLVLTDLKKLTELNGLIFEQLPLPIQRKFNKTTLRIISLEEGTSLEVRQEIFNRINTPALNLTKTSAPGGTYQGKFMDFMTKCSDKPLFKKLCPISDYSKKRWEDIELITRFFAYTNSYMNFEHDVYPFLDKFVENHKDKFDRAGFEKEFNMMLEFVNRHFPNGFKRGKDSKFVPCARFEALAVGVALALRENRDLTPAVYTIWSDIRTEAGERFKYHTAVHASNNKNRLRGRIEYVKNMLLFGRESND